MKKLLASMAIVVLSAIPFGALAHGDGAEATIPLTDADGTLPTLYVDVDSPGVWQESNDDAGLQTVEHMHGDGDEAIVVPADTKLV